MNSSTMQRGNSKPKSTGTEPKNNRGGELFGISLIYIIRDTRMPPVYLQELILNKSSSITKTILYPNRHYPNYLDHQLNMPI